MTALLHLHLFTTLSTLFSVRNLSSGPPFHHTLHTHFMRYTGAKERESSSHFLLTCNKSATFFPRNLKLSLRLITHPSLSLIINGVKAGCMVLFRQHNTGVQAASDRGNCRSEFITSPVRVPGFFIIPKIYQVIYAVTLSWYV